MCGQPIKGQVDEQCQIGAKSSAKLQISLIGRNTEEIIKIGRNQIRTLKKTRGTSTDAGL